MCSLRRFVEISFHPENVITITITINATHVRRKTISKGFIVSVSSRTAIAMVENEIRVPNIHAIAR